MATKRNHGEKGWAALVMRLLSSLCLLEALWHQEYSRPRISSSSCGVFCYGVVLGCGVVWCVVDRIKNQALSCHSRESLARAKIVHFCDVVALLGTSFELFTKRGVSGRGC